MVHDLSTMQRMNDEATSHVDVAKRQRIEEALDGLYGSRESFRKLLEDQDDILARICENVERIARRKKTEPWAIMKELTGNGSGVSAAIYQVYRRKEGQVDG